jgi:hypothetical protein
MYEIQEKIQDPVMELFMGVDGRIETALKLIIEEKDIPQTNIQRLIIDKESLLEIFDSMGDNKEFQIERIWSAYDLINKINYILEVNIID